MGCLYHPDRQETVRCYKCRADLCASCVVQLKGGRFICHRCLVAVSVEDVKSETEQRPLTRPFGRFSLRRLWSPSWFQALLLFGGVAVLILVGLQFAWSPTFSRRQIALDPENPVQVLMSLQFALEQYAVGHGERYPETLIHLVPLYLPDTAENRSSLMVVHYKLDRRAGYRLQIKGEALPSAQGLMVTRDGFHLPEFKNVVEERG